MGKILFNHETGRFEEVKIEEKQGSFAAVPTKDIEEMESRVREKRTEPEKCYSPAISARDLRSMERRISGKKTVWEKIAHAFKRIFD